MKRFWLSLAIVMATITLVGCFYRESVRISMENDPSALQSLDPMVWRPDSTRVIFQNHSSYAYIKIWVGREMVGAPDLDLGPEEGWPANFPGVGEQIIYLSGREITASGWRDLGTKKRSVRISSNYFSGGAREIAVGDWDFYGYHRLPNHWHR